MNKTEAMNYGVREDAYRAFQEHYNRDLHKMVSRKVEEVKGQEAAPSTADATREAICAMLRLIPDPERLAVILSSVNRHYQQYRNEQNGHSDNARKPPEMAQEGASECL